MYSLIVLYSFLTIRPATINRLVLLLNILVHLAERTFFRNKTVNINVSHNLLYPYEDNSARKFKHSYTEQACM